MRTRVGSDLAAGAEFWRAEDTVLRRDVAVTLLRILAPEHGAIGGDEDPTGATRAGEMIVRALRSGSFEHPGCARLLDVLAPGAPGLPADVLGAAVTEWVNGRSLAEVVSEGMLRPLAAARALTPLAAAAEEAHRHGFVLGCDHPQRVRITPDGRARMCFALPRPDLRPADDVRGLGAVLFTMLTARWPLSGADAARAGLTAADRTPGGALEPPSSVRPGVPLELDAVARGTLGPENAPGHVRTAAAVHRLLAD
ncbi:protein kinase family protein, partial [Pseudonocardia sp. KRD-182]